VSEDAKTMLIYRLYHILLNHPPVNELFAERTKVLSEAYELVRDIEEPYVLPD
jgi:hypothetical protein